jgi:hypothetical protein
LRLAQEDYTSQAPQYETAFKLYRSKTVLHDAYLEELFRREITFIFGQVCPSVGWSVDQNHQILRCHSALIYFSKLLLFSISGVSV